MNKELMILCSMVYSAVAEDPESVHFLKLEVSNG
jgi:hypothetical protein